MSDATYTVRQNPGSPNHAASGGNAWAESRRCFLGLWLRLSPLDGSEDALPLSPEPSGATGRDGSPLAIRANVYSTSVAPFTRSAWRPTRSRHLSAESLPAPLLRPPARRLVCPY